MSYRIESPVQLIKLRLRDGATHEFKLGLGPCGRTVTELYLTETIGSYAIKQFCTDSPRLPIMGCEGMETQTPDIFYYNREIVERAAVYAVSNPFKE